MTPVYIRHTLKTPNVELYMDAAVWPRSGSGESVVGLRPNHSIDLHFVRWNSGTFRVRFGLLTQFHNDSDGPWRFRARSIFLKPDTCSTILKRQRNSQRNCTPRAATGASSYGANHISPIVVTCRLERTRIQGLLFFRVSDLATVVRGDFRRTLSQSPLEPRTPVSNTKATTQVSTSRFNTLAVTQV